jgi:hypothetical protein
MSKSAFAQTIIGKLKAAISTDGGSYQSATATSAMAAVAQGITEYIIANTQVQIVYTGIIPGTPPVPDPIVTDVFNVIGTCAPPSPSDNFDVWIKQIEANIIAGFTLAPMGNAGVVFATKPFLNIGVKTQIGDLTSTHDVQDESPQQKVWEIICGDIIDWINGSAMNPIPGGASRPSGPSTGTASITKITIT